jgi:hypothetical protein
MIDAVVICDAPSNACNCDAQLDPAWPRPRGVDDPGGASHRPRASDHHQAARQRLPDRPSVRAQLGGSLRTREHRRRRRARLSAKIDAIYSFRPEHLGLALHHRNPPRDAEAFAEVATAMTVREAPRQVVAATGPGLTAEELAHA